MAPINPLPAHSARSRSPSVSPSDGLHRSGRARSEAQGMNGLLGSAALATFHPSCAAPTMSGLAVGGHVEQWYDHVGEWWRGRAPLGASTAMYSFITWSVGAPVAGPDPTNAMFEAPWCRPPPSSRSSARDDSRLRRSRRGVDLRRSGALFARTAMDRLCRARSASEMPAGAAVCARSRRPHRDCGRSDWKLAGTGFRRRCQDRRDLGGRCAHHELD